jgi:hypothetical protein
VPRERLPADESSSKVSPPAVIRQAASMLGGRVRFDAVPFFWSQHYDVTIRYVGHAERWDAVDIDGSLDARDATVSFLRNGKRMAAATVSRDGASLEVEVELEAAPSASMLGPELRRTFMAYTI